MNPLIIEEISQIFISKIDHYSELIALQRVNRLFYRLIKKIPLYHTTITRVENPRKAKVERTFLLGNVISHMVYTERKLQKEYFFRQGKLVRMIKRRSKLCTQTDYYPKRRTTTLFHEDGVDFSEYVKGRLRYTSQKDNQDQLVFEEFTSKRNRPYGQRTKIIDYSKGRVDTITIQSGEYPTKKIEFSSKGKRVTLYTFFRKHPSEWTEDDVAHWVQHLDEKVPWRMNGKKLIEIWEKDPNPTNYTAGSLRLWDDLEERL